MVVEGWLGSRSTKKGDGKQDCYGSLEKCRI